MAVNTADEEDCKPAGFYPSDSERVQAVINM